MPDHVHDQQMAAAPKGTRDERLAVVDEAWKTAGSTAQRFLAAWEALLPYLPEPPSAPPPPPVQEVVMMTSVSAATPELEEELRQHQAAGKALVAKMLTSKQDGLPVQPG